MRYRLHQSLGYQLSLTSRIQERRLDERLRTLGLTRITWCVLLAVGNEALAMPSEIADFVGIDRTATSRALRQMEAAGLVARQSGETDRRTTRVALTDLGRHRLTQGTPMAVENNRVMLERLDPGEADLVMQLLDRLRGDDARRLASL
jgi:MarR family transcriptional regulator for hemolysin